ncbi:MAG: hypothetical protein ACJ8F1_11460 [Polyangia bacterium]
MRAGNHLTRVGLLIVAALAVSTAGCFDPIFPNGKIACTTNTDCPSGFFCSDGVCYQRGADGSPPESTGGAGGGVTATGGHTGGHAGNNAGAAGHAGSSGAAGAAGHAGSGGAATPDGGTTTDGGCQNACASGDQRCGTAGLDTCVPVGACLTWSSDNACPGRQVCQGNAPVAQCKCPAPPGDCTGPGKTCVNGTVVTCAVDANGCVYASAMTTCASGEPCGGAFPNAACQCAAKPAACTKPGTFCDPSNSKSVVTCANDAAGCLVVTSTTPCTQPCSGSAGAATCGSCPAAPSECASAGTLCTAGKLERCGLDANGCLASLGTTTCGAPTTCTGTLPDATCACPPVPAACASGPGNTCSADRTSAVTCGMMNGCLVVTNTTPCTSPQLCVPATGACACPTVAACQAGAGSYCDTAGNQVVTCAAVNGCIQSSSKACGAGLTCANTTFPNGSCQCPTPPMNCPKVETYCQSNTLVACTADAQTCLHEADTNCAAMGLVCGASGGSSACICPAPTGGCGSTAGTTCSSDTSSLTCAANAQGCIQGQTTTCSTGQYCWHTTAGCAAPSALGYPTDLGATGSRQTLLGQSITLAGGTTIRSFGLLVPSAGSQVSMGLYTDQSGSPSQLVASAQSKAVAAGTNVYPAAAAAGQSLTIASGGTYWLMALFDQPTTVRQAPVTGPLVTVKYVSIGFGALPTMLSGVMQQTGEPASNYYLLITQ